MSAKMIVNILSIFVWIYTIITLPIYAIIQKPWQKKKGMLRNRSHRVPSSDGVCISKTAEFHPIQLEILRNKLDTMAKVFSYSCQKNPNNRALGTREVFGETEEVQKNGKVLKKLEMGNYKWTTYAEAENIANNFGNGLRHLGFAPSKKIVIYAETCQEWLLAAMGAFQQKCTVCTLYTSLDGDALVHGITETEVELIITSSSLLDKVKTILPRCPNVTSIITFTDPLSRSKVEEDNSCRILAFNEVVKQGKDNAYESNAPTADDIAIIMYTSGSTGTPKGVMLSHRNLTTCLVQFSASIGAKPTDIYMSFLPLAHVLEILGESCMLICGIPMGYSSPLTLTDVSSKIKNGTKGDASILKPTIVPAVPLILDRIYKSANLKISASGPIFKEIVEYFIQYRLSWFKAGWETPLCNNIVFKKTRDLLGGNVRIMGCGGAPLSTATHDLSRAILGINICQGYGLTETGATASMMDDYDDFSTGQVGAPLKLCDIKLVDWKEGGYTVFDKPNPRGEIIIGGGNIAVGYFKNAPLTEEFFYEIDNQRWFRSGDIGEILPNGTFHIIDRKKDLIKLQMGEYVSLGKIESVLKLCSAVDNICIYGHSSDMYVVAIVSLNPKELKSFEQQLDVDFSNKEGKQAIKTAVYKSLVDIGKKGNLSSLEIPRDCYVTDEAWTTDNKLVTSTMKIRRKNIENHYAEHINALYNR